MFKVNPWYYILFFIHFALFEVLGVLILWHYGTGWLPWLLSSICLATAQVHLYKSIIIHPFWLVQFIHLIYSYHPSAVCDILLLNITTCINLFYHTFRPRQVGSNMILVIVVYPAILVLINYCIALLCQSWRGCLVNGGIIVTLNIMLNQMLWVDLLYTYITKHNICV